MKQGGGLMIQLLLLPFKLIFSLLFSIFGLIFFIITFPLNLILGLSLGLLGLFGGILILIGIILSFTIIGLLPGPLLLLVGIGLVLIAKK